MRSSGPVRVLHVIDSLNGGGSERWVWDIVRLADPSRVRHRVVTVYPDRLSFVYADRLAALGAYDRTYDASVGDAAIAKRTLESRPAVSAELVAGDPPAPTPTLTRTLAGCIPGGVKNLFRPMWFRLLAARDGVQRAWDWIKYNHHLYMCKLFVQLYRSAIQRTLAECDKFQPDVVQAHTFHGYVVGLVLRLLRGKPIVHMCPALFSQMRDAGLWWMPPLYACTKQWVDVFVADTGYETQLTTVGVPRSRIHPLLGSVDVESVDKTLAQRHRHRAELLVRHRLPADALLALSIGRLHSSKGHDYALEALPSLLARFPSLHWMVLGEGDERPRLQGRARELGIADHVHLEGFVEDPLPYYAAADLYLRSMVFEGENLSSYYAMAAGLPVVGFDTGCPNELMHKAHHGILVPNRDAHALATAAGEILARPDRGRSLGRLGAAYCRMHLDIRHMLAFLDTTYRECADRFRSPRLRSTASEIRSHEPGRDADPAHLMSA